MATTRLYLDTRAVRPGAEAPVKITLCLKGKTTTIPTGIKVRPEHWDASARSVIRHPQRMTLNSILAKRKSDFDMALIRLIEDGSARHARSVTELKDMVLDAMKPEEERRKADGIFYTRFCAFSESRKTEGSRFTYRQTMKRMEAFDPEIRERTFEDIDFRWLSRFEMFLERTSKSANGRAVYFRCIRAVFNDAIDDDITSAYPFRKFKIRKEPTAKRSLTVEQLRTLMNYPCEDWQVQYRDMFILMFFLIGINGVDLFNAKKTAIVNGRLEYVRAKTHKPYSIRVYPEAMEIIRKYSGSEYLVNVMERRRNYKDYLHRMSDALKEIGPYTRRGLGGKKIRQPLFPGISQYWCRHTWATIAAELDIPKETIAAGLGHDLGNTTTSIYINFNMRKVDEANRKVIDYVLGKNEAGGL